MNQKEEDLHVPSTPESFAALLIADHLSVVLDEWQIHFEAKYDYEISLETAEKITAEIKRKLLGVYSESEQIIEGIGFGFDNDAFLSQIPGFTKKV